MPACYYPPTHYKFDWWTYTNNSIKGFVYPIKASVIFSISEIANGIKVKKVMVTGNGIILIDKLIINKIYDIERILLMYL